MFLPTSNLSVKFKKNIAKLMLAMMVSVSLNLAPQAIPAPPALAASLTNSTIDFDAVDESNFTQEDSAKTDFTNGVLELTGTAGGNTDLSGGTGGESAQTVYTAPDTTTVTSSQAVYSSTTAYYMGYLFNGTYDLNAYSDYWLTTGSGNVTLDFEFPSDKTLDYIRVYPYTRTDAWSQYSIATSLNGTSWTFVAGDGSTSTGVGTSWTHTSIGSSGDNFDYQVDADVRYVKFTLTHQSSWGVTLNEIEFVEPGTVPITQAYYTTTNDNSQIDTSAWTSITGASFTQTASGAATIKYLTSFDDRVTWKYWTGSVWASSTLGNFQTNGNTKTELEALSTANWSASGGFISGTSTTLDFAIDLKTTDSGNKPSIDQISVSYIAEADQSIDFDTADEASFVQENASTGTDFTSGEATLYRNTSGYGSDIAADMTSATTPSPNAVTSSATWSTFYNWKAFDDDSGTYWYAYDPGDGEKFLTYDFGAGNEKVIGKINLTSRDIAGGLYGIKNFTLYGSNDNSSFTSLTTGLHPNDATTVGYVFANTIAYRYFKISIDESYHSDIRAQITEMEFLVETYSYSTSQAYYVTTGDNNQIDTSAWLTMGGIVIESTEPTNTTVKYLVSFDGRSTWKYWSGSAWTSSSLANLQTNGMTTGEIEAIKSTEWSASGGYTAGTTTSLNFAMDFKTTDSGITPSVSKITGLYTTVIAVDNTMDFDVADESDYVQESAVAGTDFFGGSIKLTPVGPGYQVDATSIMTSGTAPSPAVVTTSSNEASREGWEVFDSNTTSDWYVANQAGEKYVKYDFGAGNERVISQIVIDADLISSGNYGVKSFVFSGSNNDSSWTALESGVQLNNGSAQTHSFTQSNYYRYYKLVVTDSYYTTTSALIDELQLQELDLPTDSKYVTTTDTSQLDTSAWTQITSITISQTTPGASTVKYLVSFDGRSTWKYWTGSAWASSTLGNIDTNGMSKTEIEALSSTQWKLADGFVVGTTTTMDFAFALKKGSAPSVEGIEMSYSEENAPAAPSVVAVGTTSNYATVARSKAGESTNFDLSFTLSNTLSSTLTITFPAQFTLTGAFTAGTCDSGTISNFAFDNTAKTLTADKASCTGAVSLTGATITLPGTPGLYSVTWVNDDPGEVIIPVTDDDQVSVSASVDQEMTFDIDVATSDADSSAPYAIALGVLSDTAVTGSNDSSLAGIWFNLSTNATSGAVVQVKNANGANGLVSASVSGDNINSTAGENAMAVGTENYGLCVTSAGLGVPSASAGTFQAPTGDFDGTCGTTPSSNSAGGLTTTFTDILNSNTAPIDAGRAQVRVLAEISSTTAAHDDYADTLTFRATSTF